jgi:hypothetical protein
MRPGFSFPNGSSDRPPVPFQTWQKSGSCPEGTIPIRRVQREELLSAASLEHFGRDGPQTSPAVNTTSELFVHHNGSKIAIYPVPDHSVIVTPYLLSLSLSLSLYIYIYIYIHSFINLCVWHYDFTNKKCDFKSNCRK